MRISKIVAAIVLVIVVVFAGNAALNFALVPYGAKSDLLWTTYSELDELDTVFLGTSQVERAVDPAVIDEGLDCVSLNMGTPSQRIEEMLLSLKTANEDHHIKRAVLAIKATSLQDDKTIDARSPYMRYRSKVVSPLENLRSWAWLTFCKNGWRWNESLNGIAPWVSDHVGFSPSKIMSNVRMKLDGTPLLDAAKAAESHFTYYCKGGIGFDEVYDFNDGEFRFARGYNDDHALDASKFAGVAEICEYCRDNDIELIVVGPPFPDMTCVGKAEDYFAQNDMISDCIAPYGLTYYDFNLARPELLDLHDKQFQDYEHLNESGMESFSNAFVRFAKALEAGEDVDAMFYSPKEYLESVDTIQSVYVETDPSADGLAFDMLAIAGPRVTPEYQVTIRSSEDSDDWKVLRDWSTDSHCVLDLPKGQRSYIRVNARQVGSDVDYDHYRDLKIFF